MNRWTMNDRYHRMMANRTNPAKQKLPVTFDGTVNVFATEDGWIDIQKVVPIEDSSVKVKAEIWRDGKFVEVVEKIAKYVGWNGIIGQPMFEWDTHEEYCI